MFIKMAVTHTSQRARIEWVKLFELSISECKSGSFTCDDGQCILNSFTCNGVNDCIDGSDEGATCGTRRQVMICVPPPPNEA